MKNILKVISIILCFAVIFSSCAKQSDKYIKTIEQYITDKKYNECQKYIKETDKEKVDKINDRILNIVSNEFSELCSAYNINFENIYDLTAYSKEFTDSCVKLWSIAELLNIDSNNPDYEKLAHLRFFAETDNFMRYSEIYSLMEKVYQNGYIEDLHKQINDYEKSGNCSGFDSIGGKMDAFNYTEFNPQEYLVSDFRAAHNDIKKNLISLRTGFSAQNSNTVAVSMNKIFDSLSVMLKITETLKNIREAQVTVYNALFFEKNINKNFDFKINIEKTEYSSNSNFAFEYIFSRNSTVPVNNPDVTIPSNLSEESNALSYAVSTVTDAVNKTKKYKGKVSVDVTSNKSIKMTSFSSGTKIDTADEISMSRINSELDKSNKSIKNSYLFNNGVDGNTLLSDFIPPKNNGFEINKDKIKNHSVKKGNGGYVITLSFEAEEVSDGMKNHIHGIINGFEFETDSRTKSYKTYYNPYSVTYIINNDGYIAKTEYEISGKSHLNFTAESNNGNIKAEFDFSEKYTYDFSYDS